MTHPDALAIAVSAITATVHPDLRWKIGPQASLKHDLGLDQIDRLTIACAIDEALGIEIPDADVHRWETVSDVAETAQRMAPTLPNHRVAQPNWQALGFAGLEDAEGRN